MVDLLQNPAGLTKHITCVLHEKNNCGHIFPKGVSDSATTSAVLFLLAFHPKQDGVPPEPCLILNKRSARVKQPGDLCFPGGRITPRLDFFIGRLLSLPLFPLGRWAYWSEWCDVRRPEARRLALLFAASIRESFEEMRLNPLWLKFLGPMASHNLVMFPRVIYPMVGWITRQKRFLPNWEVEKIVRISLRDLLTPEHYRCYRLDFGTLRANGQTWATQDLPCFLHRNEGEEEILWGATYFMVMVFLELVFGFNPPDIESRPVVFGALNKNYLTGSR
jgi:8-oxo-dGTP pyrophosphatase MutT (NUDIX family)